MSIMMERGLDVLADIAGDELQGVSAAPLADLNSDLARLVGTYGLAAVLESLNDAAVSAADAHEGEASFIGDVTATDVVCARLRVFAARTREALDATK